jgi:uncharacterized protein (TIGR02145 family)
MKKLLTLLMVISITFSIFAQAPQKMSYQCVVRNSSGALVINLGVGIRISILQGSATGSVVYQETYNPNPLTNANGLLTIEIGSGLVIGGTFSTLNWVSGPYFLKTETDPTGGTNYTVVGTSQLLSVPYALYAKTAGNGFSGNYNDLSNKPALFDGTWTNITSKPTTLAGYGITNAMSTSHVANGITSSNISNWNTAFSWGNPAGLYRSISWVPAWTDITSKPTFATVATSGSFDDLTGKPTTLAGYGITNAMNTSHVANGITSTNISNWNTAFGWGNPAGLYRSISWLPAWTDVTSKPTFATVATSGSFNDLTGKPTTLAGYGITNAMNTSHVANGITSTNISNWNTALSWGNHAGLYRPITYVPAWSEIISKPTTLADYGITDAVATTGDQTIAGNKTFSGTTTVVTPINATDAVTKAYVDELKSKIGELLLLSGIYIKDIEDNYYKIVTIGSQVWMAENLKTTKYNDGTAIPLVTGIFEWANLNSPAYCWYNNDEAAYKATYGALYNWYTVDAGWNGGKNVCSSGWHVPSAAEWTTLTDYLAINFGYAKAKPLAATTGWATSSSAGTIGYDQSSNNGTGFTALPGGKRFPYEPFSGIGYDGYWWSSTQNSFSAWGMNLSYNATMANFRKDWVSCYGFSVRCVKD